MQNVKLTDKQRFWNGHIEAQARSGQTRRQYCEEKGLDLEQMGYYVTALRRKTRLAPYADDFIKVSTLPAPSTHLTMRLASGMAIECPAEVRLVAELVRALT